MTCCTDRAWIEEQIAWAEAAIRAWQEAILSVSTTGQSYSLDTGQTKQTVTRASLEQARSTLGALLDLRQYYVNQLCGRGSLHIIPGC